MPSVSDIKAGRAYVEIGADNSQLVKTLNGSARQLQQWGGAIRGIGLQVAAAGAAIVTPLVTAGVQFARHGEELALGAKRTGVGVAALSTLGYAAKQSGVDMESLQLSMARMSRTLVQAAAGSKKAQEALPKGLTAGDLSGLSQEDRFKKIAQAISEIQDPAAQAAAAMGIFGRSGASLLPLLDRGAAGIERMQARAKALGLQWSTEDAEAAATLQHKLRDLWDVFEHGVDVIGSAVAPVLSKIAEYLTHAAMAATSWVKQHKALIATALLVGATLLAAGAAVVAVGTGLSIIGTAIGTIASAFGLVVSVLGLVLTPIGLVIAGLAIGAVAFFKFTKAGADAGNAIISAFKQIWSSIKFVFENTSTLSEAWAAAQTEAGLYIMEAWINLKGFLLDLWASLKNFYVNIWDDMAATTVSSAYMAANAFLSIWAKTFAGLRQLWNAYKHEVVDQISISAIAENANEDQFAKLTRRGKLTPALAKEAATDLAKTGAIPATDIQKQADEWMKQFGGQEMAWGNAADKAIRMRVAAAAGDAARKAAEDVTDKKSSQETAEVQSALDEKLAALKKEADARQAYLEDMRQKQRAANDEATAEEKTKNQKAADFAAAAAKKAREAYEAELKKRHDASGEKSIEDQFKSVSGLDGSAAEDAGLGLEADKIANLFEKVQAKFTSIGATNISSQGLANQIFGAGGEDKSPEKETAKNTRDIAQGIKKIAGAGRLTFG